MKGYKAKILVDSNATPKYMKTCSIPYYREKVVKELNQLVEEGSLEPVKHSDWASPIVAVFKLDKENVRICSDYKQTVNPVSKLDRYPIPRIEDLFSKLAGGKSFSKLDLLANLVAQQNDSLLEKEAVAIVFGVQHFHSYLVGHHFELVTDHKLLLALLHEHRASSAQASARIRCW